MYVMKVDGQAFYAPTLPQSEYQVLTPMLKQEVNTSGELTFVLPPGHVLRDSIRKMKSVLTVEQNGVEVFRGRVSEETVDTYNQKECYCEGDLSFLRDSMVSPYTYDGSAKDYFRQLIDSHNEQIDEEKRFTVGLLTALSDDDKVVTESVDYKDTLSEIKYILVNDFDGYLRTRYENGVRYIDYIDKYDDVCTQKIEFGVNLLDIENQIDSTELCTVLIPLGKRTDNKVLTIESVNNGSDRIESAEGIARYGRIIKTYAWDDVEDPAELLKLGKEKLNEMAALETLTLKAIDLHLLNVDVDKIRVGSKVHLLSKPHGLDKEEICTAIDIDMENPEESIYTFGKPSATLSGGVSANSRSISNGESENNLRHNHTMEYFDEVNNRLNTVEFDMNAVEATILLKADSVTVDELGRRVSSAEIKLDGINATIDLKVSKDEVVSAINMSPESIKISSKLIELDGAAVVATLSGRTIDVSHIDTASIYGSEGDFSLLYAGSADIETLNCGSLVVGGSDAGWKKQTVCTGGKGLSAVGKTIINYLDHSGNPQSLGVVYNVDSYSLPTTTISYLGE